MKKEGSIFFYNLKKVDFLLLSDDVRLDVSIGMVEWGKKVEELMDKMTRFSRKEKISCRYLNMNIYIYIYAISKLVLDDNFEKT